MVAGENILQDALNIATQPGASFNYNATDKEMCSREKLDKIISERTDSRKYEELKKEVVSKLQTNDLSADKDQENYAGSYISQRLARLGKPLAPLAVAATMELMDRFSDISREDLGRIREMGECEARACFRLMKTLDRRIGVNSVLASNPLEKIPLYVGR